MSVNWLILGALIGAIGSLHSAPIAQILIGALSGMIVFAIPGACLGLIGGDVKGSYVGAAGGYLGCWFSELTRGLSIPAPGVQVMVIFGALAGATCFLYLRTAVWTYSTMARATFVLIGGVPFIEWSSSRPGQRTSANTSPRFGIFRPRSYTLPDASTTSRLHVHANSGSRTRFRSFSPFRSH